MTTDTVAPPLATLPVTALPLPAPVWPLVEYDNTVWRAAWAFKRGDEWIFNLRTGKRPPVTVPARLCRLQLPPCGRKE